VIVEPAANPLEPISRVAAGSYDMAVADINALIRFRDQNGNAPVKAIFIVYDRPPYAVIGRKSRGVSSPKDLEGKKLGAPQADEAFAHWPVFAKANEIDPAKVKVLSVGFPVREPMLAAGEVDAITGLSFDSYVDLKERGVPPNDVSVLLMSDYGVKLYGNAIVVNEKFAQDKPEAVSAFLRAYVKALKDTINSPVSAIESVTKRNDGAKKEVELERLRIALNENAVTPQAGENGVGDVDMHRLKESIEQLGLTYPFKSKPKAADVFDPSFLPPANERKIIR
jgi:NitT/TauT family transport system substrate-binding protein